VPSLPAKLTAAVAITSVVIGSSLLWPALAHEGHDDAGAHEAVLPDFDKAEQQPVVAPGSVSLPGVVVVDARHDLRIVARENGVIEAPAGGFAVPGQKIAAGQILARLRPSYSQLERRDLSVEYASAHREALITRLQIDRFNLDGTQPFDIKLATPTLQLIADYRSAQVRETQLKRAMNDDVVVIAPRAGVVVRSAARAGEVAAAGQTLFELNTPGGVAVTAEYSDNNIDSDRSQQAWTSDHQPISLKLLSESYDPELRLHRALFAVSDSTLALSPGEPVQLVAQLKTSGSLR
jgi:multidrug efflux pump subunit AcrA (membrane-fusion protein)